MPVFLSNALAFSCSFWRRRAPLPFPAMPPMWRSDGYFYGFDRRTRLYCPFYCYYQRSCCTRKLCLPQLLHRLRQLGKQTPGIQIISTVSTNGRDAGRSRWLKKRRPCFSSALECAYHSRYGGPLGSIGKCQRHRVNPRSPFVHKVLRTPQ